MSKHIRFISAGAGSGKTYRVTEELQAMLAGDAIPPPFDLEKKLAIGFGRIVPPQPQLAPFANTMQVGMAG